MVGRFRTWAVVTVTILALVAAGCSSGGKEKQKKDGSMPDMENGAMKDGMMGSGGDDKGDGHGGMDDKGDAHEEEEYTPPTPEQLAKVTKTVDITVNDQFKFEPKDITVKKGEVVKFVVKNAGKLPHDWMADGLKEVATGEFPGGEERVIVWEAAQTGTWTTYCMVTGHKEAGMTGTLTVTE